MIRTQVCKLRGQAEGGPSEVVDQSRARMSAPRSPPPENIPGGWLDVISAAGTRPPFRWQKTVLRWQKVVRPALRPKRPKTSSMGLASRNHCFRCTNICDPRQDDNAAISSRLLQEMIPPRLAREIRRHRRCMGRVSLMQQRWRFHRHIAFPAEAGCCGPPGVRPQGSARREERDIGSGRVNRTLKPEGNVSRFHEVRCQRITGGNHGRQHDLSAQH